MPNYLRNTKRFVMVQRSIIFNNSKPIELHHTHKFEKEPSPPKDPTTEKVREVAGKIFFGLGMAIALVALLGLAGHIVGIVAGSAALLAALMVIGFQASQWGYNMISHQEQKGLGMKLEFKVPEFVFPAA